MNKEGKRRRVGELLHILNIENTGYNMNLMHSMLLGFGLATYMSWTKTDTECAPAKAEG